MPDDVAEEKVNALHSLGAKVQRVRPASIVDKKQVRPSTSHPPQRADHHSRSVCPYILTSQNMARQAAVRFGQHNAMNGTDSAGISP
ncbi:hypothetical protein J3R82DRAFT_10991 [Butyriboletus roseoflavus]|nr:hypothetical protein J3R82DRAFT_10991 [Butyriboletus roseoflavus]